LFTSSFEERSDDALRPVERDLRPALHSEVRVALVCYRQIFLQQDLHPALSGREIVDLPPIAERERRDVLRDPEPASSTVAAVLEYQVVAVLNVAVPLDLMDAPSSPDFSAVRLDDGERRRWWLRTIPPAGVQGSPDRSTPNDHFTAGPDCRVKIPASRRVGIAGGSPTIRGGLVSPSGAEGCTPDDHFTAGPDCRVKGSGSGRVEPAGGDPTIGAGIVFPASVRYGRAPRDCNCSTPNDHFTAGPDCRVKVSGRRRVGRAGGYPTIRAGIVSAAGNQRHVIAGISTPNDHFTAGPDCRVTVSGRGRVGRAGSCPRIRAGIVSPASVRSADVLKSAPNDHLTAGPDRRVTGSGSWRVGGTGGCPCIRARIVSSAGVRLVLEGNGPG
jgi:hypothetical protein